MKYRIPFLSISLLILFSCKNNNNNNSDKQKKIKEPEYLYGVCIDSMTVETDKIRKGEFLANILLQHGISYQTIDYIAKKHKNTFDVSKIKNGQKYTILSSNDSLHTALYWIYEINKTDYAVFGLTDSLPAWIGHKEIITKVKTTKGIIKSSLWNAMAENDCDQSLTLKLSDIFVWTIDFFGIQSGDSYKVIYENLYVEGESIGIGKVLSAEFINAKEVYHAFFFEQDGKADYFDENGDNLRKAFLKAPLNYRRISSGFSEHRMHPVLKIVRPHHGVDYAAPAGTPVEAIGDGTVIEKGWNKNGGGNYLKIRHNSTYTTTYMHLKGFAKNIAKGSKVKQGQVIGYVGSTGLATGPHLDFRMQKNGSYIDPVKFKSPSADPIKSDNRTKFSENATIYLKMLEDL